jgi:putative beta barrel porin BBP7
MRKQVLTVAALMLIGAGRLWSQSPAPPPPSTRLLQSLPTDGVVSAAAGAASAMPPGPETQPTVVLADDTGPIIPRFWVDLGAAIYFLSPQRVPTPILTSGPPASFGILGQPGTTVLIGGGDVDYGTFNGTKLSAGAWFGCDRVWGIDATSWYLEQRGRTFSETSDGSFVLARPITDAVTNGSAAALIAFPGFLAGSLAMENRLYFYNGDVNVARNLLSNKCTTIDALVGFRFVYLWEQIHIIENQRSLVPGIGSFLGGRLPAGAVLTIQDTLETANELYIGQIGLRGETARGRFRIGAAAKVGFGLSHQHILIDGTTSNQAVTAPGGILALPTNSMRTHNDDFVVAPEFTGKIGFQITPRLQIYADYTLLYVSSVARPGTQIDAAINPALPPSFQTFGAVTGPARPVQPRNVADLFAHGVSVGLAGKF